jgi:hypothetical protein
MCAILADGHHAHHRPTHIVILREHVPEPVRQAQAPLPLTVERNLA